MGTITTDVSGSVAGPKSKHSGTDSLENEAIGLEVGVRIHGSQVAAVVLDATEHVEPFEEDTSTMIVFPRGAVVKLRARVRSGHAVVLTHLETKQTALCRIVHVNNAPNIANYVKLEFVQPAPGFWGVHFPSDGAAPAIVQAVVAPEEHPPIAERPEKFEAAVSPAEHAISTSSSSATQPPQRVEWRPEPKPIVRESTQENVTPGPVRYGASERITANELVPLAAAPTKRAPIIHEPQTAVVLRPSRATHTAPEAPIFDSLSTGEEVFGKESSLMATAETGIVKSDRIAMQTFARTLDPSSLMQSVETPKTHSGMKIFLSVAAVAILAAGAVFYVRQYRGNARQSEAIATPASIPQATAPAASTATATQATPAPVESSPLPVGTSPVGQTQSAGKRAEASVAAPQDIITVTPVHSSAKIADSENHPTISNGLANIYAGDLTARPQPVKRKSAPVKSSVPVINAAPKNLPASSANEGLGSLVSGTPAALSSLPKPSEAKPVAHGGVISAPRLLHSVRPSYPALAMSNRVEGDVQVLALIDQTGKVASTRVLSGPVLLRRAATDAVQQWRYSPATLDGKPTSMEYKVTVSFHLNQ